MKKKISLSLFSLMLIFTLKVNAQYSKQDTTYKKNFVGSTLFLLGNFASTNPPGFVQLNLGHRITGRDVISLEFITWKYSWPLGINPFFNDKYGEPDEQFPGTIREYGLGLAYQRYFWKGLYAAVHLTPMVQKFMDEDGKKIDNGFHLFNTYRIGYHVKLFKDKFFLEPSVGIAGRPYHTEMPDGFKQKDDKWSKWTPEPGLHFGYNF
ncbi:hypothetical protein [Algoriphagus confluentis]|uniref:DUF3575 domain-containing protein n=1 Tax=Algoriphagus confluentis TaxID=1697556 RepID=A0ABQ6PRY9_9BACT|nr:hypothetical protein Aconfl_33350 [Algoriphagus confluentis]